MLTSQETLSGVIEVKVFFEVKNLSEEGYFTLRDLIESELFRILGETPFKVVSTKDRTASDWIVSRGDDSSKARLMSSKEFFSRRGRRGAFR